MIPADERVKVASRPASSGDSRARDVSGEADRSPAVHHDRSVAEVLSHLGTSAAGLSHAEVQRRQARHGPNVLDEAPPRSPLTLFLAQFADFMILVLLAAAVVSGLVGDLTDTLVIVAIVLLNAGLGFAQEWRAAKAMQALKAMAAPSATVLREGAAATVPAAELVPGDAVLLEAGRIVPADLRLVEAASLRIDEAALTGESVPVDKSTEALESADVPVGDRRNIAHKGTQVTYGRGLGVVVATGMRTEFGRIARLLESAHAVDTPLQKRLAVFGRRLALVVIAICIVVFTTGLLRGEPALPMLLTALSLAVAAIPEALPAVVSISLALGARRLMARHALIRRLAAVEALGSVTVICSDKTGTLTANQMRVERYWVDGAWAETPPAGIAAAVTRLAAGGGGGASDSNAAAQDGGASAVGEAWPTLLAALAVSHDASVGADRELVGDPTETAMLAAARAAGLEHAAALAALPRVDEVPFDSVRKCMTTVHRLGDGSLLSMTKGAAEVLLGNSVSMLRDGETLPLDAETLSDVAERMAADGLRVLAVGARRWAQCPDTRDAAAVESGLVFVGLLGLMDPPREAAAPAIADCRRAGIVPVMITGDHPVTARAIASRLGLGRDGAAVADDELMTGRELAALTAAAASSALPPSSAGSAMPAVPVAPAAAASSVVQAATPVDRSNGNAVAGSDTASVDRSNGDAAAGSGATSAGGSIGGAAANPATEAVTDAAIDPALAARIAKVRVFARVAPEQKLDIVRALQSRGEVVAMTGDGVNDAPALRRADIGVAMGITGTDVAREASSMVLLDDDFATVVRAVREGRRIYDNLRRFIRYVLTTNSGEIWTIFLAPFLGLPVPLLPIQILWINLVTDGLPGLALAAEPAERDVMRRPPRSPRESLFAQGLGAHALLVGMLMAAIALGLQAFYLGSGTAAVDAAAAATVAAGATAAAGIGSGTGAPYWQTMVFTALCFMQLGHVLAIRSERQSLFAQGLLSNRPLALAVALTVALQLLVLYTPAGNGWFGTVPLAAVDFAVCVAAALVILVVVEAEKWARRHAAPRSQKRVDTDNEKRAPSS